MDLQFGLKIYTNKVITSARAVPLVFQNDDTRNKSRAHIVGTLKYVGGEQTGNFGGISLYIHV